ncbi:hypothetical protein BLA60_04905 [Actinophytocola xinjiangensis]|uniref:Uncharacterized protein n=1 Tax=Actinophytocola xinjiangensis TaxID=485602 RepID=A0A7Z0WQD9_9PSEU|nr:hypothetical protein [Actinophytocola xinjiangensis]OLF12640.1 hypothetical protein BLA60_04905 [Actinophytocola xinjiangensis]
MTGLRWEDVEDCFSLDGSLRDAYVQDTGLTDWQTFLDLVRARWPHTYTVDQREQRLPERADDVLNRGDDDARLLDIRPVPEIQANVHFFTVEQIEIDFAPAELLGQRRLDVLLAFFRDIGRALGKPVIFTPENVPERPLFTYDPRHDRVTR